jgi:hypothetical protein
MGKKGFQLDGYSQQEDPRGSRHLEEAHVLVVEEVAITVVCVVSVLLCVILVRRRVIWPGFVGAEKTTEKTTSTEPAASGWNTRRRGWRGVSIR